jgi:hypothetical protein
MLEVESVWNILELQVLTIAIMILWFEVFSIGTRLKQLLKIPLSEYKKPFDCRFCTMFWIGNVIALSTLTPELAILNVIVSHIYSKTND